MFDRPSIRATAGVLFGGTAFLLLAAWLYQRTWARNLDIPEERQIMALLAHLMVGVMAGIAIGCAAAFTRRPLWTAGASAGLASAGILGAGLLERALGSLALTEAAVGALAAIGAVAGAWAGRTRRSPDDSDRPVE